jgi:hypothetical protein
LIDAKKALIKNNNDAYKVLVLPEFKDLNEEEIASLKRAAENKRFYINKK